MSFNDLGSQQEIPQSIYIDPNAKILSFEWIEADRLKITFDISNPRHPFNDDASTLYRFEIEIEFDDKYRPILIISKEIKNMSKYSYRGISFEKSMREITYVNGEIEVKLYSRYFSQNQWELKYVVSHFPISSESISESNQPDYLCIKRTYEDPVLFCSASIIHGEVNQIPLFGVNEENRVSEFVGQEKRFLPNMHHTLNYNPKDGKLFTFRIPQNILRNIIGRVFKSNVTSYDVKIQGENLRCTLLNESQADDAFVKEQNWNRVSALIGGDKITKLLAFGDGLPLEITIDSMYSHGAVTESTGKFNNTLLGISGVVLQKSPNNLAGQLSYLLIDYDNLLSKVVSMSIEEIALAQRAVIFKAEVQKKLVQPLNKESYFRHVEELFKEHLSEQELQKVLKDEGLNVVNDDAESFIYFLGERFAGIFGTLSSTQNIQVGVLQVDEGNFLAIEFLNGEFKKLCEIKGDLDEVHSLLNISLEGDISFSNKLEILVEFSDPEKLQLIEREKGLIQIIFGGRKIFIKLDQFGELVDLSIDES